MRLLKGEINIGRVTKNVTATEKAATGERNLKDSERDIEKALLSWKGRGLFVWGSGDDEAALARTHFEKLHGRHGPDRLSHHPRREPQHLRPRLARVIGGEDCRVSGEGRRAKLKVNV